MIAPGSFLSIFFKTFAKGVSSVILFSVYPSNVRKWLVFVDLCFSASPLGTHWLSPTVLCWVRELANHSGENIGFWADGPGYQYTHPSQGESLWASRHFPRGMGSLLVMRVTIAGEDLCLNPRTSFILKDHVRISKRHLFIHVHGSISRSNREMEATQASMDEWPNKT